MSNVLVFSCTHCPGMHEDFPDFLVTIKAKYKINKVIHLGDLVDWHAISFHGKVRGTPTAEEEVKAAKEQVRKLSQIFPTVDWLIGNHDALPQRKAAEANLPADLLRTEIEYWDLPGTWRVFPRFTKHEVDGVLYSHGETGSQGKGAAMLQAASNFQSTVIGHLHGQSSVGWMANENNLIFGMSVGCGMDWRLLQFEYGMKFSSKPILSCGVVIDGKYPYLEPMKL